MTTDQIVKFHWKTLARYDHYIATTNAKAAFFIAWNTFAIGTVGLKWSEVVSRFSGMAKTEVWVTLCLLIIIISSLCSPTAGVGETDEHVCFHPLHRRIYSRLLHACWRDRLGEGSQV